jgi:hypothetical protein
MFPKFLMEKANLKSQTLGDDVHQVSGQVKLILALNVVGRDHSTLDETSTLVCSIKSGLKSLSSDVVVVDVDSVGSQLLQSLRVGDGLVVENLVELELVLGKGNLLVRSDGSNDGQSLTLAKLSNDLSNGTGSGGDEDSLSLLGLSDLVEGRAISD